jgi:hypothetical protein
MTEIGDKIKIFMTRYVGFAAVALICAIYVWSEFLNIEETGKTVHAIIFDGAAAFAAGISIQVMCSTLGIFWGRSDPGVSAAEKEHEQTVKEVSDANGMDALNDWCREENDRNKRFQRTRILADVGLSYGQCFDERGTPLEYDAAMPKWDEIKTRGLRMWAVYRRIARDRMKAFRKAVFLRLSELSAGELTGEGRRGSDPFYMGRGVGEYQKQTTAKSMVSKVITSLVFGYYSMDMLMDFSWTVMLGRLAQVLLFLVFGIFSFTGAVSYMTGEFRERIRAKVGHLQRFLKKLKGDTQHDQSQKDGTGTVQGGPDGRGVQEKDLAERGEGSLDGGSAGAARAELPGADLRSGGRA